MVNGPLARRRVLSRRTLPFVNRTDLLAEINAWHQDLAPDDVGVVILHGLGGIGKSRLAARAHEELAASSPTARIDFYLPELRGLDSALMAIRRQLGKSLGKGAFPLFDLAFAHYWNLTHPVSAGHATQIPFLEESEILWDITSSFAAIPAVGALIAAFKAGSKVHEAVARHKVLKNPYIAGLAELDAHDAALVLPEYLGLDLSEQSSRVSRPVVLVETLEALAAGPDLVDGSAAYAWLESLLASSRGTLWIVTSRDPLGWSSGSLGDYDLRVLERTVAPLDPEYTRDLVRSSGIVDPQLVENVFETSQGLPFYVELAIENYERAVVRGAVSDADVRVPHERLVSRFLGHLSEPDRDTLTLLSVVSRFDSRMVSDIQGLAGIPRSLSSYMRISALALCRANGDGTHALEPLVVPVLEERLRQMEPSGFRESLVGVLSERAQRLEQGPSFAGSQWLVVEALRHAGVVDQVPGSLVDACERLADSSALAATESALREILAGLQPVGEAYWLARLTLVRLLRRRGALPEAEAHLSRAKFPERFRVDAELLLADIRREVGKPLDAVRGYERVTVLATAGAQQHLMAQLAVIDRKTVLGMYVQAVADAHRLGAQIGKDNAIEQGLLLRQVGQLHRAAASPIAVARAAFDEAEAQFAAVGDSYETARVWTDVADLLCGIDPNSACDFAERAVVVHQRHGQVVEEAKALTHLATAQWLLGDPKLARTLELAGEALRRAHYRSGEDRFAVLKGAMAFRAGDRDQAEQFARAAATSVEARDSHRGISLMARSLLREMKIETADDAAVLVRLSREIQWLPDSLLDSDGFPISYRGLFQFPDM